LLLLYDALLINLALEDFKYQKIRNSYVKKILMLSLVSVIVIPEITVGSRIAGMFGISVPIMIFRALIPGSFGGGDVKLVFVCGAFLGWKLALEGTFMALFFAGAYSLWLLLIKRERKTVQFALGPFLSIGYIINTFSLF